MIPAYVIGLTSQRYLLLKPELHDLGIDARYWQALRGDTAELGCYQSHKSLWKHIAETNSAAMIFEDDIAIRVGRKEFKLTFASSQKLDAVVYGYCMSSRDKTKKISRSLYEYRGALCTHAYWITPYAASSLLQYESTVHSKKLISDFATKHVFKHINTGIVSPPFFFQDVWTYSSALRSEQKSQDNVSIFEELPKCGSHNYAILILSGLCLTMAFVWAKKGLIKNPLK